MTMEWYFVVGLLAFLCVPVCVVAEHWIAARWLGKDSLLVSMLRAFEQRHPGICDNEDSFYCFFKRTVLQQAVQKRR